MRMGPLVIIGDALLDADVEGDASRLCPDAPAPVLDQQSVRSRPGGAALAAVLAAAADESGHGVTLIAPFGPDEASRTVLDLMPPGVTVTRMPLDGAVQVKTRLRARGQTLLRVDQPAGVPGPATADAIAAIDAAGALLVSDYGHGAAADPQLRDALIRRARRAPLVWDPHPRGAAPVPGTMLATPNSAEAAALSGLRGGTEVLPAAAGGTEVLSAAAAAERLLEIWPARSIAVTLGSRGAILQRAGQAPVAIPAMDIAACDPCGAGDRFAAAAAISLRDGATVTEAVTDAVAAASLFLAGGGVASLGPTPRRAGQAPGDAAGRPGIVVAAGGCFDVLHAGHVSLLRAARALGDRLVVCLNSDESVRRLKGPGRPINGAADRIAVLTALDCVDEVVTFDEDTPERLLTRIRPAIWVKGGDYEGRELPEEQALRRWGGRVVTVPYLAGRSTTRIAERWFEQISAG